MREFYGNFIASMWIHPQVGTTTLESAILMTLLESYDYIPFPSDPVAFPASYFHWSPSPVAPSFAIRAVACQTASGKPQARSSSTFRFLFFVLSYEVVVPSNGLMSHLPFNDVKLSVTRVTFLSVHHLLGPNISTHSLPGMVSEGFFWPWK